MRGYPSRGLRARTLVACLLGTSMLAAAGQALAQPSDQIETVTVTAEKRETVLQRTPDAITALDGGTMAQRGAVNLNDLANYVPNVSFSSNVGATQIYIRGIGNTLLTPGADPGVAFYSDGAYVSDQWANNVAFFDVARIEVLRGPQGSLYGRNATGGAVNIISLAPTDTFEAKIGVLAGDYGQLQSEGYVSGPLGDGGILGRFSYQLKYNNGFTRNELKGTPGAPDRVDDLSTQAFRLQFEAPVGEGTLRVIGGYFKEDDNGPTEKTLYEPNLPAELLYGAVPSMDERSVKSEVASLKREVKSVTAQFDHPIGAYALTVIAAYRKSDLDQLYDQDGTEEPQALTGLITGGEEFNVDARIASDPLDRFNWLAGVTYVDFTQERLQTFVGFLPLGFVAPGFPLNIPFALDFQLGGNVKSKSSAAYFDAHYRITEQLTLSGGLRYTHDEKEAYEFQTFNGGTVTNTSEKSWSSPSGKLGLDYQVTDDVLIYGSVARGFKSGAIAVGGFTVPAKPEIVDNAEVGLKSTFWDNRAQLNVAAFLNNYKDMQVFEVGALTAILSNASKARIGGIEIEGILKPLPGLTLDGSLGYNDATYEEFTTADLRHGIPVVDVSGNQLPLVSKFQYHLGAEYAFPVLGNHLASLRVDYAWRDKYFFTEFNTADAMQDAYGTIDLSASLASESGWWRAYAFLRNLTDETTANALTINSSLLGSSRLVNLNPPRRFGIGVDVSF